MKPVRERFKQSERIIASFVIGNDETLVHVAQAAGVHVLILDFEHGMMTKDAARRFINAARHTDVAIFARCPKGDVYGLNALLDHDCTASL